MVIKVQLLFLILFFGPLVHFSFAAQSQSYIDKANALELSSDPFWRNILHFKGRRSQIIDKSFFFFFLGRFDAQAELEATINAYFGEGLPVFSEHKDQNIVCIYPARYTWLNEKLDLPDFHIDTQNCPILSEWTRLNEIDAISIFYVSGYLSNPESSFCHAILNMKTKGEEEKFHL
ncbi:MAG: hypothetical protein KC618_02685, partial [Candidatus Omnitrophica bacterium]|nr:hypothetical protein [Candidatus Omnitrophota bacterium]